MSGRWLWLPLAAVLALCAWWYRGPLLLAAANVALHGQGVELVELRGLRAAAGGMTVDALHWRMGGDAALQRAQAIDLGWDVRSARLRSLRIGRLALAPSTGRSPAADAPLPVQRLSDTLMRLPLERIRVDELSAGGGRAWQFEWRRVEPGQRWQWRREQLVLTLALTPERGGAVAAELIAERDGERLARVDAQLRPGPELLHIAAAVQIAPALLSLSGMPQLSAAPEARLDGRLTAELPADLQRWRRDPLHCDVDVALRAPSLTLAGASPLTVQRVELALGGRLRWQDQQLSFVSTRAASARGSRVRAGQWTLENPMLLLEPGGRFSWQRAGGEYRWSLPGARLSLPRVQAEALVLETALQLSAVAGRASPAARDVQLEAELVSDSLRVEVPGQWLPVLALASQLAIREGRIAATGEVDTVAGNELLRFAAGHHWRSGRGAARLEPGPWQFSESAPLSSWFSTWPFAFDVLGGSGGGQVDMRWRRRGQRWLLGGDYRQRFDDVSGFHTELAFIGLDAALTGSFSYPDEWLVAPGSEIRLQSLDAGVPIDDIAMTFAGAVRPLAGTGERRDKLHFSSLRMRFLGGELRAAEHLLLRHRLPGFVTLDIDGIALEELLRTVDYGGIEASGRLSGALRLKLDEQGISARAGRLSAEPPGGVLRYTGSLGAAQGAAVDLVQQVMGNYHYRELELWVDYLSGGDLLMSLQLDGSNPDFNRQRRIKLNVNVEQNVPDLLRSLQAGREIEQLVEKYLGH